MKNRCTAHRKNGDRCKLAAIKGGNVCRNHGGAAPQVKRKAIERLLEAADPAAAELVKLALHGKSDQVKLNAIRDLLDRAQVGKSDDKTADVTVTIKWPE